VECHEVSYVVFEYGDFLFENVFDFVFWNFERGVEYCEFDDSLKDSSTL
jgi:hypothetical protein